MNAAVVLALVSGTCWALNIVTVRWALGRTAAPPLAGAFVGVGVAAVVAVALALGSGAAPPDVSDVWRFAVVGAIAPGSSQGLFVAAIGAIGPARSSVLVGTAPMLSVLLAILLLDESWRASVLIGTVLTVAGGALISWERVGGWRRAGVLLALATALSFAVRDVVAREVSTGTDLSAWWAAALVLGAAAGVTGVLLLVTQRQRSVAAVCTAVPDFLLSGMLIGLALPLLLEALDRGEVGIVAPLSNAAQNLAVVVFGAALFGVEERSPRVLAALAMVVTGGAIITIAG